MSIWISRVLVMTHTGDDNKDRGDGVTVKIYNTKTGVVYLDLSDYGVGLVYQRGDDNGWDRPTAVPLPLDDAANIALWVEMNHDDGDWHAAFSLTGFMDNGSQLTLMRKTAYQSFGSGNSDAFQFPLTYRFATERSLAQEARVKFPEIFARR